MYLRTILGSYFLATAFVMFGFAGAEWNSPILHCRLQLRPWMLTQAIGQLVAVLLSFLSRKWLGQAGRDRNCKVVSVALLSRGMNLFLFSWFIVGMVWMTAAFNPNTQCKSELPLAWYGMLMFLVSEIICLIFGTMVCLCSCVIVVTRMLVMTNGRGGFAGERRNMGASAEEIRQYTQVKKYREEDFPDQEDAKCVVCLGEYEVGDDLRYLRCNHHFHIECVDQWLQRNSTCPLCVRSIAGEGDEDSTESTEN